MDKSPKCPICGKEVASSAAEGLCPECLLKGGLETGVDLGDGTQTQPDQIRPKFTAPEVSDLENLFPQLDVLELIGQGGMGAVYKARQKKLDRIVALKILPPDIGGEATFAERFSREAKALAKLNHPGIVTIHDFGIVDIAENSDHEHGLSDDESANEPPANDKGSLFYFLMEYVDGVNLQQLLQGNRISSREALSIVPQICDALQYAHDHGIVHRDIKPENILMNRQGAVKVADFGLAKMIAGVLDLESEVSPDNSITGKPSKVHQDLTESGKIMGTPKYMSPEQIESPESVDHRADIYALGVVFYQMLTGELPAKKLESPSRKVSIDVRLDEVVLKALEKDPTKRFQDVSSLKTRLESVASTEFGSSEKHPSSNESQIWINLKNIPWQIWIVLSILGMEGFSNLLAIPVQPEATIWLIAKVVFAAGMVMRWKIVYALMLVFMGIHVIFFALSSIPTALMNLFLLILAGSQHRLYFDDRSKAPLSASDRNIIYKVLALISWGLSLPAIGFGTFFLNSLLSERGGWNPSPAEAIFVPSTWLCSFLLPCAGWFFWKRAKCSSVSEIGVNETTPNLERNTTFFKANEMMSIITVVFILFLTATGNAIIMVIGGVAAVIACLFWMPRNKFLVWGLVVLVSMGLSIWVARTIVHVY